MATSTACPPWSDEQKQSDGYNGQMIIFQIPLFNLLALLRAITCATVNHTRQRSQRRHTSIVIKRFAAVFYYLSFIALPIPIVEAEHPLPPHLELCHPVVVKAVRV